MAEAHDRLGFVLGHQGRTDAAVARFERRSRSSPTLFDAHYHLGVTEWLARRLDPALPALEAAVGSTRSTPKSHYYLGLTLRARGDLEARCATCAGRPRWPRDSPSRIRSSASPCAKRAISTVRSPRCSARLRFDPASDDAGNAPGPRVHAAWRRRRGRRDVRSRRQAIARRSGRAPQSRHRAHAEGRSEGGRRRCCATSPRATPRTAKRSTTSAPLSSSRTTSRRRGGAPRGGAPAARARPKPTTCSASCCGRRAARPKRPTAFRAALARRPGYAEAHYMLGTVLRQKGEPEEALAEFEAHARARAGVGRGLDQHRPDAAAAARCATAPRRRSRRPMRIRKTESRCAGGAVRDQGAACRSCRRAISRPPYCSCRRRCALAPEQAAGALPAGAARSHVGRARRGAPAHGRSAPPRARAGARGCEVAIAAVARLRRRLIAI